MIKIKECYIGATISKKTPNGRITLDTETAKESDYQFYFDNGFDIVFEEVKPKTIQYKGIDETEIPMKIINNDGKVD